MHRIIVITIFILSSCSEYKSHPPRNPHMDPADVADYFETEKMIDEASEATDTIKI